MPGAGQLVGDAHVPVAQPLVDAARDVEPGGVEGDLRGLPCPAVGARPQHLRPLVRGQRAEPATDGARPARDPGRTGPRRGHAPGRRSPRARRGAAASAATLPSDWPWRTRMSCVRLVAAGTWGLRPVSGRHLTVGSPTACGTSLQVASALARAGPRRRQQHSGGAAAAPSIRSTGKPVRGAVMDSTAARSSEGTASRGPTGCARASTRPRATSAFAPSPVDGVRRWRSHYWGSGVPCARSSPCRSWLPA